jgi:hypothetical protein
LIRLLRSVDAGEVSVIATETVNFQVLQSPTAMAESGWNADGFSIVERVDDVLLGDSLLPCPKDHKLSKMPVDYIVLSRNAY